MGLTGISAGKSDGRNHSTRTGISGKVEYVVVQVVYQKDYKEYKRNPKSIHTYSYRCPSHFKPRVGVYAVDHQGREVVIVDFGRSSYSGPLRILRRVA